MEEFRKYLRGKGDGKGATAFIPAWADKSRIRSMRVEKGRWDRQGVEKNQQDTYSGEKGGWD